MDYQTIFALKELMSHLDAIVAGKKQVRIEHAKVQQDSGEVEVTVIQVVTAKAPYDLESK